MRDSIYGDALYLFHRRREYADDCVISAHGRSMEGCCGEARFDVPPRVTLIFYSHHKEAVKDFGIRDFMGNGRLRRKEDVSGGDRCRNYVLAKYQGAHSNNKETYETLESEIGSNANVIKKVNELNAFAAKYRDGSSESEQEQLLARAAVSDDFKFDYPFDIVTVRNRWWRKLNDMTLEKVVNAVLEQHEYKRIHCFFCRS